MTARNMQDEVKKKGLPWSAVKGFDTFTPVGSVYSWPLLVLHHVLDTRVLCLGNSYPSPPSWIPTTSGSHSRYRIPTPIKKNTRPEMHSLLEQINDAIKQDGTTADMIFRIPRLIEHISSIMSLEVRPPKQSVALFISY